MFGSRRPKTLQEEFRSVIEVIENGTPINPRHSQPATIDQGGFSSCINEEDRAVFARTVAFGTLMNRYLSWGGWRVQEKNANHIPIFEDPLFGRRFDLFYNSHETGEVYIYAAPHFAKDKAVEATVAAEIEYAQFYEFSSLRELLRILTITISDREGSDIPQREIEVDRCLTGTLWEIVRCPNRLHTLSFRAQGPASHLKD